MASMDGDTVSAGSSLMAFGIFQLPFFNFLENHPEPVWLEALCWGSIPLLPKAGPLSPLIQRPSLSLV